MSPTFTSRLNEKRASHGEFSTTKLKNPYLQKDMQQTERIFKDCSDYLNSRESQNVVGSGMKRLENNLFHSKKTIDRDQRLSQVIHQGLNPQNFTRNPKKGIKMLNTFQGKRLEDSVAELQKTLQDKSDRKNS